MPASRLRRLTTAVAVTSMLAGCAQDLTAVPSGPQGQPPVVATDAREQPFCSAHEWVCILAGLAVVGGVVAIIKGTGNDTSTDN